VTQKFDVSVLKKADRGAIISQVKNWSTSWVNYCENEAEYLKSFSLFTAFMDRHDVKEQLCECHTYVMDTYIAVTWMAKKEKLLFYNRLTTRNFDQCTSCPMGRNGCESPATHASSRPNNQQEVQFQIHSEGIP
jgi:hypothetical protein